MTPIACLLQLCVRWHLLAAQMLENPAQLTFYAIKKGLLLPVKRPVARSISTTSGFSLKMNF
jgi:hypothetical protein